MHLVSSAPYAAERLTLWDGNRPQSQFTYNAPVVLPVRFLPLPARSTQLLTCRKLHGCIKHLVALEHLVAVALEYLVAARVAPLPAYLETISALGWQDP